MQNLVIAGRNRRKFGEKDRYESNEVLFKRYQVLENNENKLRGLSNKRVAGSGK